MTNSEIRDAWVDKIIKMFNVPTQTFVGNRSYYDLEHTWHVHGSVQVAAQDIDLEPCKDILHGLGRGEPRGILTQHPQSIYSEQLSPIAQLKQTNDEIDAALGREGPTWRTYGKSSSETSMVRDLSSDVIPPELLLGSGGRTYSDTNSKDMRSKLAKWWQGRRS